MHGKHNKKMPKLAIIRIAVAFVLVLVLSVSSLATVMANTVSASVIDGDKTYSFSMNSTDLEEMIRIAEDMGLTPLGPLDICERVGNTTTVNIRRGVSLKVTDAGKETAFVAYIGDTVEKAISDNNIIIKEKDEIAPAKDTVITEDTNVVIKRVNTVTVLVDGKKYVRTIVDGTVGDIIGQLNIQVGEEDSVNYDLEQTLFDNICIRVTRAMKLKITADGETQEYTMSAINVKTALREAKIELQEEDRVTPDLNTKIYDGIEIVVQRVKTEEEVKTEPIPFETKEETSDSLYEGESEVKAEGVEGEKEIKLKKIFVDGTLEKEEVISEEVKTEPVDEIVIKGTKKKETSTNPGGSTSGGVGTFVDNSGNVVSYQSMLSGSCTAYYDQGTTATGVPSGVGYVAVNPNIIPYGTKLYIAAPDGSVVYGYCYAADTGGALMAGDALVDLFYNTREECIQFGRRTMNVYIVG